MDDTLAMRRTARNNFGEMCESHLVASCSTDFPAASLRYGLSYSLLQHKNQSENTERV